MDICLKYYLGSTNTMFMNVRTEMATNTFQMCTKTGASIANGNGKINVAKTTQDKIVGHKEH